MARIRTIKPEAFRSRHLAQVPPAVRWTFAGLWTLADDGGSLVDDAEVIKADLYLRDPDVTPEVLAGQLDLLVKAGLVCRYEIGKRSFLHMPTWAKHQRINRPSGTRCPACPRDHAADEGTLFPPSSVSTPEALIDLPVSSHAGKGREGKGSGNGRGALPTVPVGQGDKSPTPTARAQALAAAYCGVEKLSNFPAVMKIARKAIDAGRWPDEDIRVALLALAEEHRPVSVATLIVQLSDEDHGGIPPWERNGK